MVKRFFYVHNEILMMMIFLVDMVADLAVVQIISNQQKLPYLTLGDSE